MSTLLSWLSPRFFYFFEHLEGSYIKVFVLYICRLAFLRGCFCWCSPLWTDGPCFACLVISLLLKTGYCNLIMQELWKSDFLPSPGFAGFFVCFLFWFYCCRLCVSWESAWGVNWSSPQVLSERELFPGHASWLSTSLHMAVASECPHP